MSLLTWSDLKHALLSRHTPFQSLHTCMPQLTQHHAVNLDLHYSVDLPSEGGKKSIKILNQCYYTQKQKQETPNDLNLALKPLVSTKLCSTVSHFTYKYHYLLQFVHCSFYCSIFLSILWFFFFAYWGSQCNGPTYVITIQKILIGLHLYSTCKSLNTIS